MTLFRDIFNKDVAKKYGLIVLLLFLFFLFENEIENLIAALLPVENVEIPLILDGLIIFLSVSLSITVFIYLFTKKYEPSFFQKIVGFGLTIIYFNYQAKDNDTVWIILEDNFFHIDYILYFLFPVFVFCYFYLVVFIAKTMEKYWPSLYKEKNNSYLDDDPLKNKWDDLLSYRSKIESLTSLLLSEQFAKSFSIGLVGPWGNGKSSVIYMVQEELETRIKNDELISIHFLPYLNHNEDDIINEFFISLSKKLSVFSGKLSNDLLRYAKKITDIYNGSNVLNLFENHVTSHKNTSAKELYESINNRLCEIDKKIVVFVDDLDRLSGKEIIEVLKLVRNTADFHNTIFVVAMDKDYVINRLKSENNISSARFIDKFFQLEVYLPEIDKSILHEFVYNKLKNSTLSLNVDFEVNLLKGINHQKNLFNDFIKNIRDAKRLVNQILFDYPFLREEIDFKDFMNFTYFKLKFPKFVQLLNERRFDYLKLEKGEFTLKEKPQSNNKKDQGSDLKLEKILIRSEVTTNDYSYLDNYLISDVIFSNDDCIKDIFNVDCEDRLLLLNSLAHLFGKENEVESFNSIRKENNFRMLMQQRVFENVLLESEFKKLLSSTDFFITEELIEKLHSQSKTPQLLNRLEYFNDKKFARNVILILLALFNRRSSYEIIEGQILPKLGKFVDALITDKQGKFIDKEVEWNENTIFVENKLTIENRLFLIGELWDARKENKLWGINKAFMAKHAFALFKAYLGEKKGVLWAINNYSFFRFYSLIKSIPRIKPKLNKEILAFWKNEDIELLCVQVTNIEAFKLSTYFIADSVDEMFGSKIQFHEFVKKHPNSKSMIIKEFLEFFNIYQITGYNISVMYQFKNSKRMWDKIKLHADTPGRSGYAEDINSMQIVIKCNSKEIVETIIDLRDSRTIGQITHSQPSHRINRRNLKLDQFSHFTHNAFEFLFIGYDRKQEFKPLIEILKAFEELSAASSKDRVSFEPYKENILNKKELIIRNNEFVQVYSIQPLSQNNNLYEIY